MKKVSTKNSQLLSSPNESAQRGSFTLDFLPPASLSPLRDSTASSHPMRPGLPYPNPNPQWATRYPSLAAGTSLPLHATTCLAFQGYSAHIPTSRPSTLTLASHRNDALGSNNTFTIVVLICFQNVVFTSRYSLTTHMQLFINYVYSVVGSHYSTLPQRYLFHF